MTNHILPGFFGFAVAYGIYMLFALKLDPRFSLTQKTCSTLSYILGISTLEKTFFFVLLILFSLAPQQDFRTVFGFNTLLTLNIVALSLLTGAAAFILGAFVKASISFTRMKYAVKLSPREMKLKRLLEKSVPTSLSKFFIVSLSATYASSVLEELVFRGYLLSNLLLVTNPVIAVAIQALLYYITNLFRGAYDALIPLCTSLVLGVLFVATNSIYAVIVARLTCDTISLLLLTRTYLKTTVFR